jgi:hypothetical protein
MRVKFQKRWRAHHAGNLAEIPDGVANVLIKRGIAEKAKRQRRRMKPFIESAPDPD